MSPAPPSPANNDNTTINVLLQTSPAVRSGLEPAGLSKPQRPGKHTPPPFSLISSAFSIPQRLIAQRAKRRHLKQVRQQTRAVTYKQSFLSLSLSFLLFLCLFFHLSCSASISPVEQTRENQLAQQAIMGLAYNVYLNSSKIFGCKACKTHLADYNDIVSRVWLSLFFFFFSFDTFGAGN